MNSEASEVLQNCSPLQRTRTHRCVYLSNAIDNGKIIVPELIYESKYTPNTVTALLQHAEARKEYDADKATNQNRYSPQSKQMSIMRKSDYISPVAIPSAPAHQRSLLPRIGRSSAKPSTSTGAHISGAASELTSEDPTGPTSTSVPQSPESGHIVQLTFTPDNARSAQTHSLVRISSGSPTIRTFKHRIDSSPYSTIKSHSKDQLEYKGEQKSPVGAAPLCTPAPSRVQSRLQAINPSVNTVPDNNAFSRYKRNLKGLNIDSAFSIQGVVNELLALPTPQVRCTSPSLRMRFLDSNQ